MVKTNKIKINGYNIHTIKTSRYKTSTIYIHFNLNATLDNFIIYNFLSEVLNESSSLYKDRKEISIKEEELYNARYSSSVSVMGETLVFSLSITFINEKYIEEEDYLDNIVTYFLSFLLYPNIKYNKFNIKPFNFVKKNILEYIKSFEERAFLLANTKAFNYLDPSSTISYSLYGKEKELKRITPSILYNYYLELFNNKLDVYIIGDTNFGKIINIFKNNLKINNNNKLKLNYYTKVKEKDNLLIKEESSVFGQSHLFYMFNLDNLTLKEENITMFVYNYILGSGGLRSRLYQVLREKNKYCYQVTSSYFRFANLLSISISFDKKNKDKIIKEIDNIISDLCNGNFTLEEIDNAINNLSEEIDKKKNKDYYILNNYMKEYLVNSYSIKRKLKEIKTITKEEIICLAKKVKKNTIFILNEEDI